MASWARGRSLIPCSTDGDGEVERHKGRA